MSDDDLLTGPKAAELCGINYRRFARRAERGEIKVAMELPGRRLYRRTDVVALRDRLRAEAEAALARLDAAS